MMFIIKCLNKFLLNYEKAMQLNYATYVLYLQK